MKTLTVRELNRETARVINAVQRGECFELRRNGKVVGYLTRIPPAPERKPDWKAHFDWLRKQADNADESLLAEFEEDRKRLAARERALGNLQ
jgi:antitoxin (DNA-binding transcriptional repressor) of toxin-antitoxin stability system